MDDGRWRELARRQDDMLAVRQLVDLGVSRSVVRHKVSSDRWVRRSEHVLSTTTGELTQRQLMWLGVLHAGDRSLVGGLTAATVHGLRNWTRDEVTVLVDDEWSFAPVPGVEFVRTRRTLPDLRGSRRGELPVCALEPAVLLFAARERSARSAQGVLAAAVQQELTTPELLLGWIARLRPLRRAPLLRRVLEDVTGGAQSLAEIDVRRMCRSHGLPIPVRQRARLDRDGRRRFTDCEWRLADGRVVILEVDGAFHLDVVQYGEDVRRHRRLSTPGRIIVRCTALELRDDPDSIARDLLALGVLTSCA
ncbi:hypothetical protein D9V37_17910 [Nocardioides mangrovicus]|uniref:DUF559 domain-containing protein n=1 Tax=Nocardioides mangrovicus TaxID=2478913 RepID=A0A3L8P0R8_9ACTN|nr:hypothetical protein [Nocardioides mangrovicus]RLV47978.1 hypothetical protein D9V37_17910 [Nocardioides mangrovicus]